MTNHELRRQATPVAAKLIEYTNHPTKAGQQRARRWSRWFWMVAPLAPHLAEELWNRLGTPKIVGNTVRFPVADERYLVTDTVEHPVQVNGKVRGRITVASDADRSAVEATALGDDIAAVARPARSKKVIVVPGRLAEPRPPTARIKRSVPGAHDDLVDMRVGWRIDRICDDCAPRSPDSGTARS